MTQVKTDDGEPEKNLHELFRKAALEYGMKPGGSTVVLPNGLVFLSNTREGMAKQVETIGNLFSDATQANGFLLFNDNDVVPDLDSTLSRERRATVGGIFVYYDKDIVTGLGSTAVNPRSGGRLSDGQENPGNPVVSMNRHEDLRNECITSMLEIKQKLHVFKDLPIPTAYFYDLRGSRNNRVALFREREERDRSPPASRTSLCRIIAQSDRREAYRAYRDREDGPSHR